MPECRTSTTLASPACNLDGGLFATNMGPAGSSAAIEQKINNLQTF